MYMGGIPNPPGCSGGMNGAGGINGGGNNASNGGCGGPPCGRSNPAGGRPGGERSGGCSRIVTSSPTGTEPIIEPGKIVNVDCKVQRVAAKFHNSFFKKLKFNLMRLCHCMKQDQLTFLTARPLGKKK